MEAKEVETLAPFPQMHDPRLRLLRLEAELGEDGPQRRERALGLTLRPTHHDQIVGVADERAAAARLPGPVKPVEVDVCEQGRDHPALRSCR